MKLTQNRELSWLRFNQRVLEEAADPRVPLLERLKFLAIFTSNLDEFYMIRCGSLYDLSLIDNDKVDKKSMMTPSEQLDAIYEETRNLYLFRDQVSKDINRSLYPLHLSRAGFKHLTKKQLKYMSNYFDQEVAPLLSPQIIDSHHPFPHLTNKEQYVFIQLENDAKTNYAIIGVPNFLHRIIYLPDLPHDYILLENLICHFADRIFKNSQIKFKTIIRVTRNADINLDEKEFDDDEDYRQYMKNILKKRARLAPIRLEIYKYSQNQEAIQYLCKHLNLTKAQVFVSKTPLELSHIYKMIDLAPSVNTKPLLYEPFEPQTSPLLNPEKPLINQVFNHDVLLFYPYQNIDVFLQLLKEASTNKNVVSIKITIYRLAKNSKIVRYLTRAAENGKEVTVLMELRARFDENNNINAAEALEEAGCHILYGFDNYKVHSKVCLITYKTKKGFRYITQIGTGNYNEKTSKMYTDISYITSRDEIGRDAQVFFQNMNLSNLNGSYDHLWVSPSNLKSSIIAAIDEQITLARNNQSASIMIKMNSFTDLDIIKKLIDASKANVKVKMVIRGICCLLPGIPDETENIEIHSIVGRYLEHSRIYIFGAGDNQKVYISSADFMTRNTEKRVEIACPIYDPALKKMILDYFEMLYKDNMKARILKSDGTYQTIDDDKDPYNSQEECMRWAIEESKKMPKDKPKPFFSIINKLKRQ